MADDYYRILGVERTAGTAEIKKAYRHLARKYHPDVNNGDPHAEAKFKQISEAYAVLCDPHKRRQYDLRGSAAVDTFFRDGSPDSLEIFESAFGGMPFGHQRTQRRGQSLRVEVEVTLEEVLTGATKEVEYTRIGICEHCAGTGAEPGSQVRRCPTCGGSGQVRQHRHTFMGTLTTIGTCPECGGQGEVVEEVCQECEGQGVIRQQQQLSVEIPPGIETGRELIVEGAGNSIPGGGSGDLYVRVRVAAHDVFERHGQDLETELTVSFPQVALGDTIEIPTLDSKAQLKIPPGTQSGAQMRLRSQGLPSLGGGRRGDLLVTIQVATPIRLTQRQKELLTEFARETGKTISPKEGFLGRMKDALGGG